MKHAVLFLMGCIDYPYLWIFIKYINYTSDLEAVKGICLEQKRKDGLWFVWLGTGVCLSLLPHAPWKWPVWGHCVSNTCFVKGELEHLFGKGQRAREAVKKAPEEYSRSCRTIFPKQSAVQTANRGFSPLLGGCAVTYHGVKLLLTGL